MESLSKINNEMHEMQMLCIYPLNIWEIFTEKDFSTILDQGLENLDTMLKTTTQTQKE